MNRRTASASLSVSYTVHDSWTESYVGTRHLVYEVLPEPSRKPSTEAGTLSQLALIGANQLMEIALFRLLLPYTRSSGRVSNLTESLLKEATYAVMLSRWVPAAVGVSVSVSAEPFISTEALRRKRNDAIHKTSAPVSVAMARSALATAVAGSKSLYAHFSQPFPYDRFLVQWPLPEEQLFSALYS